jgi:hypothetical protein
MSGPVFPTAADRVRRPLVVAALAATALALGATALAETVGSGFGE